MVTFGAILLALFETVMLLSYFFGIGLGWLIIILLLLVIPLWAIDSYKNTENLKNIITLCSSSFFKKAKVKICSVCSPDNRTTLPKEHVFCYACGKHLSAVDNEE